MVAHEGLVMSVESEVPVCVLVVSAMGGSGRILQHRPHVLHGVAVVQAGGGQLLTPLPVPTLNYSFYGQPLTTYLAYLHELLGVLNIKPRQ